jgi:hypothetical protein
MSYTEQEYRVATWLRIELKEMKAQIDAGALPADILTTGYTCQFTPGDGAFRTWVNPINEFLQSAKGKREFGDTYVVEYDNKKRKNILYKR